MRVENLFGLYTYELPADGSFGDAVILYGDNGVGKSTILRLAFHLLSASSNRGHRTALSKIPFDLATVRLSSGVSITAKRSGDTKGPVDLSIEDGSRRIAAWEYRQRETTTDYLARMREALTASGWHEQQLALTYTSSDFPPSLARKMVALDPLRGKKPFLEALEEHAPTTFILNADRRLDSDAVSDPDDEVELRRLLRFDDSMRIHEIVGRAREIAVSQALAKAARWMNKQVFDGANQGSMNVHSVYSEVLRHLISTPTTPGSPSIDPSASASTLANRLRAIEARTIEFAQYDLTTHLAMSEFTDALASPAQGLISNLLQPYVASLERRLEALNQTYQILHRFVTIVNSLLHDKSISFRPSGGFVIHNRIGSPLSPGQLSSGEQQLLLLLCYVLARRDEASIFMIDEPEISLNVKWQRQLVQSLLDLTRGTSTQFVLASHSMELLAQHRSRVVRLTEST